MSSILVQLQKDIADYLTADPFFSASREISPGVYATIPVVPEIDEDLENEIDRAINELGIAVVVAMPNADVTEPDTSGPKFSGIKLVLRVGEDVTLNRGTKSAPSATGTLKPALEVAETITALLHHWRPPNLTAPLYAVAPTIVLASPGDGMTGHDIRFETAGHLSYALPVAATPVITNTAGEISITCATAGAAIFYSIDKRHPGPRSGTLYTAPFSPGSGVTVKARAWLYGHLTSAIATVIT